MGVFVVRCSLLIWFGIAFGLAPADAGGEDSEEIPEQPPESSQPTDQTPQEFDPGQARTMLESSANTEADSDGQPEADAEVGVESVVQQEAPEGGWISRRTYIAGGVVGSIFGFGFGHMLVGEWRSFGWVFTTGWFVGSGLMLGSIAFFSNNNERAGSSMIIAGAAVLGVVFVWEKIDLWFRPRDRLAPEGMKPSGDGADLVMEGEASSSEYDSDTGRRKRRGGILLAAVGCPVFLIGGAGLVYYGVLGWYPGFMALGGLIGVVGGVGCLWGGIVLAREGKRIQGSVARSEPVRLYPQLAPVAAHDGLGGGIVGVGGTF